jgi:hypothetical protein
MGKVKIIIIGLMFYCNINAQNDSLQHVVKFSIDANTLLKGDGITVNFFEFEKAISKKTSVLFGVGYDLYSSNLIIDNQENVVSSQSLKMKFDYRYYFSNEKNMSGLYLFPSIAYNLDITNEDNQKNNQIGFSLGLGYQKNWKRIVIDIRGEKDYSYSYLRNNEVKFKASKINPFNLSFSVGFNF